jgi:cell division inhibitor SulA
MNIDIKYPIVINWLRPFRRSQQKTCLSLEAAQANSLAFTVRLEQPNRIGLPGAVNGYL